MKKLLLSLLLCLSATLSANALDLGDKAIAVNVDQWVTGEEVDPTVVDNEHFYVVEVWSTTCPPCVDSIPMMNEVQKRYADQGLRIVSFTSDPIEDVKAFLEQVPMEYSSFIDKEGGTTVSYMAADNRTTIPHAFLFDKSGVLVWIGNPLDDLETRVKDVLSGKLNGDRAVAIKKARDDFQAAMGGQDKDAMLTHLKALEALEPENPQYFAVHYSLLTEYGAGTAEDVKELLRTWYAAAEGNAQSLFLLAQFAMEQGAPSMREPALALEAARKAYALGGMTRIQSGLMLAESYKSVGRIDKSLEVLRELTDNAETEEEKTIILSVADLFKKLEEAGKNPDAPFVP